WSRLVSAEPPSFSGRQPAAPYFKGFQEVRSKMRQELCIRRWVEGGKMTTQLGQGSGINIFNQNIVQFEKMR
ncbi:hypothetical protein V4891_25580, partial [Ralstonia solanacearum species complex bacterium KE055]